MRRVGVVRTPDEHPDGLIERRYMRRFSERRGLSNIMECEYLCFEVNIIAKNQERKILRLRAHDLNECLFSSNQWEKKLRLIGAHRLTQLWHPSRTHTKLPHLSQFPTKLPHQSPSPTKLPHLSQSPTKLPHPSQSWQANPVSPANRSHTYSDASKFSYMNENP